MKRAGIWALVIVVAVVGISVVSQLAWMRGVFDDLFGRETTVASGDVVLKRLKEQKELVAATGTFEVPVVVCNGTPTAYDLQGEVDEDSRTPAQQLLEACDGLLDEKATVLVSSEVDAVIDLGQLGPDDVTVTGNSVTVNLPPIELAEPQVDAERGVSVIGKDGSVPIIGGDLPEDYQALAAGAAKDAVAGVAEGSGLPAMGRRSAERLFEGLLGTLGFSDVTVTVAEPKP